MFFITYLLITLCIQLQASHYFPATLKQQQQTTLVGNLQIITSSDTPYVATEKHAHNQEIIGQLMSMERGHPVRKLIQTCAIKCYTDPAMLKQYSACVIGTSWAAAVIYFMNPCSVWQLPLCAACPTYTGPAWIPCCALSTEALCCLEAADSAEQMYAADLADSTHPLLQSLCLTPLDTFPVAQTINIPNGPEHEKAD